MEIIISELILIGGPIPLLLTNILSVLAQTPLANYTDIRETQAVYLKKQLTNKHTWKGNKENHTWWHWAWATVELLHNDDDDDDDDDNNNKWNV
jgi:hypothetical protein